MPRVAEIAESLFENSGLEFRLPPSRRAKARRRSGGRLRKPRKLGTPNVARPLSRLFQTGSEDSGKSRILQKMFDTGLQSATQDELVHAGSLVRFFRAA